MVTTPFWDRVFSIASWFIVAALLFAAVSMGFNAPSSAGPVAGVAGVIGSQIFYTVLYSVQALMLAYSKVFKRKKMRKNTLMFVYLTGFFTTILTLLLVGWTPKLIDNIAIGVVSAGCWLYWKFKTEYLDPGQFYDEAMELRRDPPPNS